MPKPPAPPADAPHAPAPERAAESDAAAPARGGASGPPAPAGAAASEAAGPGRASAAGEAGSGPSARSEARPGQFVVGARKHRFLVAPRTPSPAVLSLMGASFAPLALSTVEQVLRDNADVDVLERVGGRQQIGALAAGMGTGAGLNQGVLVTRMTEQKAGILRQQGQGRLLVEADQPLMLCEPAFRPTLVTGILSHAGTSVSLDIVVLGPDGTPVPEAEVTAFGSLLPTTASTNAEGRAQLSIVGDTLDTLRGLYIKPRSDYWSFYQRDPDLAEGQINQITLRPLGNWPGMEGFPQQKRLGWGQRAMRLDQLPPQLRGQGIRVAIVDSGIATSHPGLSRVRAGFDIINKATDPNTWHQDTLGHGSHCAGVVGAADLAFGIRGFAPDAEIHACKLFPGGQVSQLIDALEYCIEHQIDVVNLSLGGSEMSEALEQQIQRAREAGVACIAAAGNSGGAVQFPAASPYVLAVAALGKADEFPADSYHSQTMPAQLDANGYFVPTFSCSGPQIDVCAPGVAITSTVPANSYAAWDGTSMAAPHITGLAALVLAHHPEFQSLYFQRGPQRVDRLFQILRMSARPLGSMDREKIGYGLPDVLVALGLQPSPYASVSPWAGLAASTSAAPARFGTDFPADASLWFNPGHSMGQGGIMGQGGLMGPGGMMGPGGIMGPGGMMGQGMMMQGLLPQSFGPMGYWR